MSAVNAITLADRAVIFTDAAFYDAEGRLVHIGDKVAETSAGLAVAGRGNAFFGPFIGKRLERGGWTIDDVEAAGGALIDEAFAATEGMMQAAAGKAWNDVWIFGWSAADQKVKIAQWSNCPPDGVPRFSMVTSVAAPDLSAKGMDRLKHVLGHMTRETADYEQCCLEMLKVQRFEAGVAEFGCAGQFLIGGHIQRTEVTASGVRKSIVHRWPEDRIGETIRPLPELDAIAHPNAVPLNRAERRRQAKLGRAVA